MKRTTKKSRFLVINDRTRSWKTAFGISLLYFLFSFVWIYGSDFLLFNFISDPLLHTKISTLKGTFFIIITSMLLFVIIKPTLTRLGDKEQVILESRNELKVLLFHDSLTGLYNRKKLTERLPFFLNDELHSNKALLYIDVDNIKLINDTMGHEYGDTLIAAISKRIASILRPPDELYKLGGDEFIILLSCPKLESINEKAFSIIKVFEQHFSIDSINLHTSVSIGIALYPQDAGEPSELLKYADVAMYQAKKNGKNTYCFFNKDMLTNVHERMMIGEQLHDAMINNEFEVYFQPQIATNTKKVTSFEALIRWKNPSLGNVSPDKFISIAEETHIIIPMGEWVLWKSCLFLKRLQLEGHTDLTMSVNVSMIQLLQNDFHLVVQRVLNETGISPHVIELEVTESVLMESFFAISSQLQKIRAMGIAIALDDFGKGYSSLSYLEQLPITVLKIDKVFINGINQANCDASLTGSIVRIGKKLGLIVIAEGVEEEWQVEYLAIQQCDKIQGWVYSKALCEEDALSFTRNNLF